MPLRVARRGIFGRRYEIGAAGGPILANGSYGGWNFTLSRGGGVIATVARKLAFREKFTVDIADGEDDVFLLAVVLAIIAINDGRRKSNGALWRRRRRRRPWRGRPRVKLATRSALGRKNSAPRPSSAASTASCTGVLVISAGSGSTPKSLPRELQSLC